MARSSRNGSKTKIEHGLTSTRLGPSRGLPDAWVQFRVFPNGRLLCSLGRNGDFRTHRTAFGAGVAGAKQVGNLPSRSVVVSSTSRRCRSTASSYAPSGPPRVAGQISILKTRMLRGSRGLHRGLARATVATNTLHKAKAAPGSPSNVLPDFVEIARMAPREVSSATTSCPSARSGLHHVGPDEIIRSRDQPTRAAGSNPLLQAGPEKVHQKVEASIGLASLLSAGSPCSWIIQRERSSIPIALNNPER